MKIYPRLRNKCESHNTLQLFLQIQPVTEPAIHTLTHQQEEKVVTENLDGKDDAEREDPVEEVRKASYKCPICFQWVANLSRHMRSKKPDHQWTKQQAKYTAVTLGLRK